MSASLDRRVYAYAANLMVIALVAASLLMRYKSDSLLKRAELLN